MKRTALVHLGISMLYFWVIILMSWNVSGGDILAIFFVSVCVLIHLFVVLLRMILYKHKRSFLPLLGVLCGLALHVLSFYLISEYRQYRHEVAGGNRVIPMEVE
ncbi:glucan phosphoethanolaminetransferase (alkaline phosphatase superfamily) [Pontibacter sp. HSC-36F09]|nr:glucan phosphoethanolaminetransferase (alkaline phosphatase superfamily) [Pontibacter sp. HSC-36F09]